MLQLSSLPCRAKGANCKNTNRTPRTPSIDLRVQWIPPSSLKLPWSFGSSHHEPPQRPRGHYYLSRFIIHSSIGGRRHRPIRPADLSAIRLDRLQLQQKKKRRNALLSCIPDMYVHVHVHAQQVFWAAKAARFCMHHFPRLWLSPLLVSHIPYADHSLLCLLSSCLSPI